jgi:hypothetical protein
LADAGQIRFGADVGGALSALSELRQAISGATAPVSQLKAAFADASAAIQQNGAAALAAFRANMREMVAERAITLGQALRFDIAYTAQHSAEERARLEAVIASDAATLAQKAASYGELVDMSARYSAQLAQDQAQIAEAAERVAAKIAGSFRHAFDRVGSSFETAITDLLLHRGTRENIGRQLYQSLVGAGVNLAGSTLGRAAASFVPGSRPGDDLGTALASFASHQLLQLAELVTHTALLSGIFGNTAETAVASGASAAGSAFSGASAAGGIVSAGANAGGFFSGLGSFFGGIGTFLGFAHGGIVPSAARGWALPHFAGATPALLHSREMVLPAPISEGLQSMIGQGTPGGGGGDMHLHFHGPSDGPAVERWFTGLMARNPGVVRNMLRSNALTPRTL